MAVTCARCGTQNPDGNQFCQACGTPLAIAAAQPPAGSVAPPAASLLPGPPPGPPPPPGYQSPYYAATAVGPQPTVHRTPWVLIISAIVVLVVIMAGCGTGIALLGNWAKTNTNSGGSAGLLPSPSPQGSPTATPATTTGSTTVSNNGVSFRLPAGWTVESKDSETITVSNPNGDGSLTIASGASSPAQTAQQNKDTVDKFFQGKYPDTKVCTGTKTTTGTINGRSGIFWVLCFTLSAAGQSIQAEAPMFAGANTSGSVYYAVLMLASQSNVKSFIAEAAPILDSIQWKLA
jgi:hypothetical protein